MGVVVKQGFWTSLSAYLGAILGLINQIFLFPTFMTPSEIGLYSQLQSFANLIVPFAILGMTSTALKYTPVFRENKEQLKAFTSFLFIGTAIGWILVTILAIVFKENILNFYEDKAPLVGEYFEIAVVLIFLFAFTALNGAVSKANYKVIVPNFLNDVLVRILGFILICLYGFGFITFEQTIWSLIAIYTPSLLIIVYQNIKNKYIIFSPAISKIKEHHKSITIFALFSILSSAGTMIVLNVDIQMVTIYLGLDTTGIYTRAFYMAIMIELPRRALSQIATPVISNALRNNDINTVSRLYKSLSVNQTIIGCFLFLGVTLNLDYIYDIMPNGEEFRLGATVVYILGFTKLLDMIFSVNSEIIVMSDHYRINVVIIFILSLCTILLNYLLIPIFGINGCAIASLISVLLFNILKMVFVWTKIGIQPFSKNTVIVLIVGVSVYFLINLVPDINSPFVNILIRSSLITILFCSLLLILKVSDEANKAFKIIINKLKQFIS